MSKKIRHISDLVVGLNKEMEARYDRKKELELSFVPSIDEKLYGLNKKKLIVVAGRPSNGKSAIMMNMAWCFAQQGKKTLFFNLETTNEEFTERLFSYVTRTDNFAIKCGSVIRQPEYTEKINSFSQDTNRANLILSESYGKTFEEIVKVIENTGDEYDCIFIDYLQKINYYGRSERECFDQYLNSLTDLAIEKDVCIVIGSQINRGTYDGKKVEPPMLHEMKGSGGIEEKAHQVWLLHWAWWYNNEGQEKNKYRIHIAKNKDGRTGVMELKFYPQYYAVTENDKGEYEVGSWTDRHCSKSHENKSESTSYFHD